MGKGDRRSRKGKIFNNSYGKKRPGRDKKPEAPVTIAAARTARSR